MKKRIITICLALTFAFAAQGVLSGCKKDPDRSAKGTPPKIVMLNSFESTDDLRMLSFVSSPSLRPVGRAALNTNSEYVTDGKASLAVYPYSGYSNGAVQYARIRLNTNYEEFPLMDFWTFQCVIIDLFNSGDEPIAIEIYAQGRTAALTNVNLPRVRFELPAKQWFKARYDFFDGAMKNAYPVDDIRMFYFEFLGGTFEGEPAPVYFDNFSGWEKAALYAPERADNELMFFEDVRDLALLTTSTRLSVNSNLMFVTQGSHSVKVLKPDVGIGVIRITDEALGKGGVEKLRTAVKVLIDVFNANSRPGTANFSANFNENVLGLDVISVTNQFYLPPGEWVTLEFLAEGAPMGYFLRQISSFSVAIDVETLYLDNFRVA